MEGIWHEQFTSCRVLLPFPNSLLITAAPPISLAHLQISFQLPTRRSCHNLRLHLRNQAGLNWQQARGWIRRCLLLKTGMCIGMISSFGLVVGKDCCVPATVAGSRVTWTQPDTNLVPSELGVIQIFPLTVIATNQAMASLCSTSAVEHVCLAVFTLHISH